MTEEYQVQGVNLKVFKYTIADVCVKYSVCLFVSHAFPPIYTVCEVRWVSNDSHRGPFRAARGAALSS